MKLSIKIAAIICLGVVFGISIVNFLILPAATDWGNSLKVILVFIFAVIPASSIVWFLIYYLLIRPVANMNEVSKVIATGNLALRVKIKAVDEIGELASNFNTIINNLTSGMQNMANSLRNEKTKERELAASYVELDKERAKDEALLTSIGDGVVAIDNQQKIILLNKAAGKMIGIDPGKASGQLYSRILKFQDESSHKPADDFIRMALKGEQPVSSSRMMLQAAGSSMLPILHTTSPILSNRKEISGVVVILKDITRERELEKLKDEFVSLASHELRTPMTAIKGLISMVFEGDYGSINEALRDPLSDIAKSTDRLIQLVNDMLDVSRIESGRVRYAMTEVSIPDVANEIVQILKPLSAQKNIKMEVLVSPINKVKADLDKIKQILINLVSNAVKFTDHGSVVISYRPWGKFAYISVTDSGVGITKENQLKLFGKFAQISSSQMGRPPGTGLGLYLSREFARGMGGEMWIDRSEPGKGSTFTFALPLVNDML